MRFRSRLSRPVVLLVLAASAAAIALPTGAGGQEAGAPPTVERDATHGPDAISPEQLAAIQAATANRGPVQAAADPLPYPFYPQGGILWQDLYTFAHVDLNNAAVAFQDFDCTDYAYDTHKGHDSAIRSFKEQAIGVPVFAALDGTVIDTHDGEPDMNTTQVPNTPSNYVILDHGGTHQTWYFHLKNGSVAVSTNQQVTAGTQLGLTASSGVSSGPHLHFESRLNGTHYEPSNGPCRSGASNWVRQVPIRREMYVVDHTFSPNSFVPANVNPPLDEAVRTGTFPMGTQTVNARTELSNLPPTQPWRVRLVRPDNSVAVDFNGTFGNATTEKRGSRSFNFSVNLNVAGTWRYWLDINSVRVVDAPLTVSNSPTNRAPNAITVAFDPASLTTQDVPVCRVNTSLITEDPDYPIMRYRYQWTVNGVAQRDVTVAALSDALRRSFAAPGNTVRCTVTPSDGTLSGPSAFVETTYPTASATILSTSAGDPGSTITMSATGAPQAFVSYVGRIAATAAGCPTSSFQIAPPTQSAANGNIPPTPAVIPANIAPGGKRICWVRQTSSAIFTTPAVFTVL